MTILVLTAIYYANSERKKEIAELRQRVDEMQRQISTLSNRGNEIIIVEENE